MSVDLLSFQTKRPSSDGGVQEMSFYQSWARSGVYALLRRIRRGTITVVQGGETVEFGEGSPRATVTIKDPETYKSFLLGGDIGVARAYVKGLWEVDDLTDLVRIFVNNRSMFYEEKPWYAWLFRPFQCLIHRFRKNTPGGSRDNIRAHYDLGNEFFRTFLDETMNYSCAVFGEEEESLTSASIRKMDQICDKLQLKQGDDLLEIGTGWGGLALHAAREYGCNVTTTTLSEEQYEYTQERVKQENLDDQVTVLNRDYRELTGTFDRLVSVEMIEAVGHEYLDTFFESCQQRLRPGGRMVLQAITIRDQAYERYRRSTDFIRHYIFPGGCLPSIGAMTRSLGEVTDLTIKHLESMGEDYVRTLRRWRSRFENHLERIDELGYDEPFRRLWRYYLSYCEGGFREGLIDNHQLVLTRPDNAF